MNQNQLENLLNPAFPIQEVRGRAHTLVRLSGSLGMLMWSRNHTLKTMALKVDYMLESLGELLAGGLYIILF